MESIKLIINLKIKKNMKKIFTTLLIALSTFNLSFATVHIVNTQGMSFVPSALTINVGDTVTFNCFNGAHNVNGSVTTFPTNPDGFTNPQGVSSNWSYTKVFTIAGFYNYQCDPHIPGMVGTITVNSNSIYDIVAGSNDHTTLKAALDACSLDGVLSGPGPFTLFAPTDAAFNLLPPGTVTSLLNNIPQLTDILKHHVVGDSVMSGALSNGQIVMTLLGTDVTITINSSGDVFVDNAQVIIADYVADNGVVHVIDNVLMPPKDCNGVFNGIASADSCGTCHKSYVYAGMGNLNYVDTYADTLNFTGTFVLAGSPMDQQFNPNWVNDPNSCPNTIYDIVSNSTDHTTLKAAIDACSLDGVLSGSGPMTLFAPTDAAFDLLPAGTVASLLNNIPELTDILKHHVVADSVMSGMLSNGQVVTTLFGTDVSVTINASNEVFIDNAQVILSDLVADNGVVHVINAVLLPPTTSVIEETRFTKSEYLFSLNILGKKVKLATKNQILFDVYSDGSIIKRFGR